MSDIGKIDSGLIDISSRSQPFGGSNISTYSVFRGLNALGGIPALLPNTDNQGYVFFTKPCLNLSYDNVIPFRKLVYLADTRPTSMGNAIRCMLSPSLMEGNENNRSLIVDDKCAFLPISNLLRKLSAPPDIVADVYTSSEGYNKEQISFIDSKTGIYNAYDLTAEFQNMEGDPITSIFDSWIIYAQRVLDGTMLPFPRNQIERRVDYQTRIYRLIMDRNKEYVQKISVSDACFPTSVPRGGVMGYDNTVHITPENDVIQVNFRCIGAEYDDPILIQEFNNIVATFNPAMSESNYGGMVKIKGLTDIGLSKKALMNYRMYPRISATMELEWYADPNDYQLIMENSNNLSPAQRSDFTDTTSTEYMYSPWTNTITKDNGNPNDVSYPSQPTTLIV